MTNQSRRLLKILNKVSGSIEQPLSVDFNNMVILNDEHESISLVGLAYEIDGLLRLMVDNGYIVYNIREHFPEGEFYLTHKGLHWKQLRNKALFSYILKSVLVPIVVSVITTAVILKLGINN